ncbi:MAG: hypothetical protein J6J17_02095 [Bacilli bacterium]|nr:hypothetical protein [Bacilli bacterium]
MKKKFNLKWLFVIVPIIAVLVFTLIAFLLPKDEEVELKKVEYITKDNRTSFSFYEDFSKKEVGEYDLYASKKNKQIIGVFTYNLNEYEENSSKEILENQIKYFLDTRKDMKLFKKETTIEMDDKIITKVEYSGKTDNSSDCVYIFSVIDFKADTNYVVYSNEVIIKDDYENNIGEMIDILKSAKLN